ncbi:FAD/NAD(P)-binding domain-containing protein [Xylariaceae sp. FL0804]|nr:FAD/NAD(P)-binding domain-containing protein [Xylariaceae sp. FL0804]
MVSDPVIQSSPRRVAIVGGGISGIACSWSIRDHDFVADIFETGSRLGGHANSVPFEGNGEKVNVDTGFIAMDETTYPQFNRFLGDLGIKTIPTDMSFGVATADGSIEWGSHSVISFIGCISNVFRPSLWRLLFDILRFSLFAKDILYQNGEAPEQEELGILKHDGKFETSPWKPSQRPQLEAIGEYLRAQGYSEHFIALFLIPMVAAPWCIDPDEFARTFPAKALIKFMLDHRLLDTPFRRLRWRSFRNGSRTYVDAFQNNLPCHHRLHLNTTIQRVRRAGNEVVVRLENGTCRKYDHVILAIHANQALRLLGDGATHEERTILGSFKTTSNTCYLHSDTSVSSPISTPMISQAARDWPCLTYHTGIQLLPKRPSARVAWNCFVETREPPKYLGDYKVPAPSVGGSRISITFDMNKLQAIPMPGEPGSPGRVLVSMNPLRAPSTSTFQSSQEYQHPLVSSESILMAPHLNRINGVGGIFFAGAWMGFGFHEDGFAAGAHAARMLIEGGDAVPPLDLVSGARFERVRRIGILEWILRLFVLAIQWLLTLG